MINVTKTYLPDRDKYKSYIDSIFDSNQLTNNGHHVKQLTQRLSEYLGVKNLLLVSNGTLALQIAYKLLELKGDVITTPFSFVATTSSLVWEGLNPIFADIDRETLTIDPQAIENEITSQTTAIVATHVFGNACDIEAIDQLAKKYQLKVVYDAAHTFGVHFKDSNILNYGDISMISFHSTKLFHTIEGGALVIQDEELYDKAQQMINFGITGPSQITSLGINAKMNEFQAAMGLCVLDDMDFILQRRKEKYEYYTRNLEQLDGIAFPVHSPNCNRNYSYFPVLFETEEILLRVVEELNKYEIYPRRYFYPSLESLGYVTNQEMKVSPDIACTILCLPLFVDLEQSTQIQIIEVIKQLTS